MALDAVTRRASGCLFGSAFGDALGARTEFLDVGAILRRFPPDGPRELEGDPALVTDDTQMALAVGEALVAVPPGDYAPETLETPLREAFVRWLDDPENVRAPGMTCLTACGNLKLGVAWAQATVVESKGCGANMRVAPVGLLPGDARPPDGAGGVGFDGAGGRRSGVGGRAARPAGASAGVCRVAAPRVP